MAITLFSALTVVICTVCLAGCVLIVRNAVHGTESQEKQLRSNTARIKSLSDSLEETQTELEKLANKVKMQRVRNVVEHSPTSKRNGNDEPDPYTDPDGWRKMMSDKIARARHGL
jgi:septal ring factor EnvC (AmiA/AmiB activator)